jgi:uncharacterized membrane protein
MPNTPAPFSIREALVTGWRATIANFWSFLAIIVAGWIVSALTGFNAENTAARDALAGLVTFLAWILVILIQMGFIRVVLKVLDGGKPAFQDFSSSFTQFLKFLAASILAGIAIAIGFILLVIPGIFLAIRLQFYSYLVIDKNMGPVESIRRSWAITRGQTWNLFILWLVLLGIILAGVLLLGVGLILAVPVTMVAAAFVYRKLSDRVAPESEPVLELEPEVDPAAAAGHTEMPAKPVS